MTTASTKTRFTEQDPERKTFLRDVIQGLEASPKRLPCKYFYDQRGSALFDRICDLDEYYVTRTELQIMQRCAREMGEQIGPGVMLVEYGSGSSIKTRILLDHLIDPVAYCPVDISRDHLLATARGLAADYPDIEILPVCADFTRPFVLPVPARRPTHAAVYFPGSTIGNFEPAEAKQLLAQIAPLCGEGGGLLIGIDLQKDTRIIEAAYNDREGVTDQFNRNILQRINRELGGDFAVEQFQHSAKYETKQQRVSISLVSRQDQTITIRDRSFRVRANEAIHTEYSHKYTIDGFAELAGQVGLELHRSWTDARQFFGVLHLVVR
jgi:dimethylhistidine N-methyltransferase